MYRLEKQGVIRETVSQVEAEALQQLGYIPEKSLPKPQHPPDLQELSVKALYELCRERGLEIPKGTKKEGLLALLEEGSDEK